MVHKAFGTGMILNVTPMGGDALVEIAFDKGGTKRLMLKSPPPAHVQGGMKNGRPLAARRRLSNQWRSHWFDSLRHISSSVKLEVSVAVFPHLVLIILS